MRVLICFFIFSTLAIGADRARDLGIAFDGNPGPLNAITDVAGVEVGQVTIQSGRGVKGELHTARTGVTVVFPRGKKLATGGVPGNWASLNANGEATGVNWLKESGFLEGPVALTNTQSIGLVRDSIVDWIHRKFPGNSDEAMLPVAGETDDSWLNDLYSFHVKKEHVFKALNSAKTGPVAEGAVGAGTGTVSFGFKAGIGTSSRRTAMGHTVGVLVQSNFGRREDLKILGVPVGKILKNEFLGVDNPIPRRDGSIVVVLATDAPLLPHQLQRLANRVAIGLGRTGSVGRNSSGDFFIAFSTMAPQEGPNRTQIWTGLKNDAIDGLFEATVQSTEEAIINSLVAAKTTSGINGCKYFALPHDRLRKIMFEHAGNRAAIQ